MILTTTERGFALARFADHYGHACSIQKSRLLDTDCIWLGVDSELARMLLSRAHVAHLLPLLQTFVATGDLVGEAPDPPSADLIADLWRFIEERHQADMNHSDDFDALRERVRAHSAPGED